MAITQELNLKQVLESSLAEMNLSLSEVVQSKLIDYIVLLKKWNQVYSLTAIDDLYAMLIYHILDSLSIHQYVMYGSMLDFGTGAGLPGLPLALALPDCQVVLLDSNRKKTTFLTYVVGVLGIKNVEVICSRAEIVAPKERFVNIVTRATESISCIIDKTHRLLDTNGQFLIMKGKYPSVELIEASGDFSRFAYEAEVHRLLVPLLDAQRHLVCIKGIDNGKNYCHCESKGRGGENHD